MIYLCFIKQLKKKIVYFASFDKKCILLAKYLLNIKYIIIYNESY